MGKKRVSVLGSEEETQLKNKKAIKLEQKKLREGKNTKAPAASESVTETEEIQKRSEIPAPEALASETSSKKVIKVRSKSYKSAKTMVDMTRGYSVKDSLALLKKINLTKFDPTVELHLNLGKLGASVSVELPYSTGKTKKIAIADDVTIAQIEAGQIDFDILLASSSQMPKLVKLAKILGPKGLMPNPKTGTVVENPETTAKKMSGSNMVTLRTEKSAPLIHTIVGKLSQPEKELTANIESIFKAFSTAQISISKAVIKSTMSPAIKLQV